MIHVRRRRAVNGQPPLTNAQRGVDTIECSLVFNRFAADAFDTNRRHHRTCATAVQTAIRKETVPQLEISGSTPKVPKVPLNPVFVGVSVVSTTRGGCKRFGG